MGEPRSCAGLRGEQDRRICGRAQRPLHAGGGTVLALKFLIHLIGDLHQPLHAADHHDRGGNCISLSPPQGAQNNLHAYWDVSVVNALGQSAAQIAEQLDARLSAADIKEWTQGTPQSWAMDTFEIGRRDAYALPSMPTCQSGGSVALSPAYRPKPKKMPSRSCSRLRFAWRRC